MKTTEEIQKKILDLEQQLDELRVELRLVDDTAMERYILHRIALLSGNKAGLLWVIAD